MDEPQRKLLQSALETGVVVGHNGRAYAVNAQGWKVIAEMLRVGDLTWPDGWAALLRKVRDEGITKEPNPWDKEYPALHAFHKMGLITLADEQP